MKYKIRKIFIVHYFLLFICVGGYAQDIRADIKHMYTAYSELDRFYMDISVKIYKQKEDRLPAQNLTGQIKKSGKNYFASIGDHRVMVNNEYTLYIDEKRKMIIVKDNKMQKRNRPQALPFDIERIGLMVDSAIKKSDTITYLGASDRCKIYNVGSKKHLIQSVNVSIDTGTGFIKNVTYLYDVKKMKSNNKVEVDFAYHSLLSSEDRDFVLSEYIVTKNGKEMAIGKYFGYKIYRDTLKGLN